MSVISSKLAFLAEIAPDVGLSPGAFYQGACRGEIQLVRIGDRWAVDRAAAEAFAARLRAKTASVNAPHFVDGGDK